MKIQKKLLLLLCMVFISGVSYGMHDEEATMKKKRVEFYEPFLEGKKINSVLSKTLLDHPNIIYITSSKYKNSPLVQQLGKIITNSPMDAAITTDNSSYMFLNLTDVLEFMENLGEKILRDQKVNLETIATAKKLEKRKPLWERRPLPCITLAFLAGGRLSLKLYNIFYGKQQN